MEDSNLANCDSCGTELPLDDLLQLGQANTYGCTDCFTMCQRCDDVTDIDNVVWVQGHVWCDECRCDHAFYCDSCDEYYNNDRVSYYCLRNGAYCEDCIGEHADWCEHCEEWEEEPCGVGQHIHPYMYKPDPIFIGESQSGLFMGWEVEADCVGRYDRDDCAQFATPILEGIAYIKEDSSVSTGIEIVTHPVAHNKVRELDVYWDTIEKLRSDYGMRAWDVKDKECGLHVHTSRAGFSGASHLHRFLQLVYGNPMMMSKFAGRTTRYATFQDVWEFDEYGVPHRSYKSKMNRRGERNSAVNTYNEHTIELRFFRGTMRKEGILACLDLTQAMIEYTRDLRANDVIKGLLSWEALYDYVEANNGIYPDAYNRMPRVSTINLKNLETLNA